MLVIMMHTKTFHNNPIFNVLSNLGVFAREKCGLRSILIASICCSIFGLGGCVGNIATTRDVSEASAITREESRVLKKEFSVLSEKIENLEYRIGEFQKRQDELTAYLRKLDVKINSKNSETFNSLNQQMAKLQKRINQDFQQLRRSINRKIDEINRILSSVRSTGSGNVNLSEKGTYHTVAEGDSLWSIAQKYKQFKVTTDDIKKANNIPLDNDTIKPDQTLFIPIKQ